MKNTIVIGILRSHESYLKQDQGQKVVKTNKSKCQSLSLFAFLLMAIIFQPLITTHIYRTSCLQVTFSNH